MNDKRSFQEECPQLAKTAVEQLLGQPDSRRVKRLGDHETFELPATIRLRITTAGRVRWKTIRLDAEGRVVP